MERCNLGTLENNRGGGSIRLSPTLGMNGKQALVHTGLSRRLIVEIDGVRSGRIGAPLAIVGANNYTVVPASYSRRLDFAIG